MKNFLEEFRKKLYRLFLMPFANWRYIRTPAVFKSIYSVDPAKLFILTVAFNDSEFIALQHRALKKFIQDPYEYFVVDNSNNDDSSREIKAYCARNAIHYVRLPRNVGWGGISHGFALNWAYRNIVQKLKPVHFGFVDHDLFPIRQVSINKYLAQGDAWGISTRRRPSFRPWEFRLYLWVGLAFYRFRKFGKQAPNFLPAFGLDTGGRIALKAKDLASVSDVYDFFNPRKREGAPNIKINQYGDFVHFHESAGDSSESFVIKKHWMEEILKHE
jgi:glycosyltransferase involved in cell wall biosynthesis